MGVLKIRCNKKLKTASVLESIFTFITLKNSSLFYLILSALYSFVLALSFHQKYVSL